MIVTFQDIYKEILSEMGLTEETVETPLFDSIKLRINQMQDFLFYRKSYEWRMRRKWYTTKAPITTGTVAVTQGSRVLTFSSSILDNSAKFATIIVNGKAYKIDPHSAITGTTCKIVAPYPDATNAAATYSLVFTENLLDPTFSAITNVYINDCPKRLTTAERMMVGHIDVSEPEQFSLNGMTDYTYYSSGTVSLTQGSKTVTGSSTAFSAEMEGMPFRVNEFAEVYTIGEVVSTTELTLREEYQGATGAGKSYKIAPEGSMLIQAKGAPNDRYFVEVEGLIKPRRLVLPTDISLLPSHAPLLFGSIWYALHEKQEKNPVKTNAAKATFRDSIKIFDEAHRVVNNLSWQSEYEVRLRQQNATRFNPLEG